MGEVYYVLQLYVPMTRKPCVDKRKMDKYKHNLETYVLQTVRKLKVKRLDISAIMKYEDISIQV